MKRNGKKFKNRKKNTWTSCIVSSMVSSVSSTLQAPLLKTGLLLVSVQSKAMQMQRSIPAGQLPIMLLACYYMLPQMNSWLLFQLQKWVQYRDWIWDAVWNCLTCLIYWKPCRMLSPKKKTGTSCDLKSNLFTVQHFTVSKQVGCLLAASAACRKETWICLPTSGSLDAPPWSRWKTAATAEQLVRYTEIAYFFPAFWCCMTCWAWMSSTSDNLVYQYVPPTSRTLPGGSELGRIPPENKSLPIKSHGFPLLNCHEFWLKSRKDPFKHLNYHNAKLPPRSNWQINQADWAISVSAV